MLAAHLKPQLLKADIRKSLERLKELDARMRGAWTRYFEVRTEKLEQIQLRLENVDYKRVLQRGFALVKDASGKLVTSIEQAKGQVALEIIFKDGAVKVKQ